MTSDPLTLPDEALLRHCRVETFRASGPGGQHRNKTDSAARITHLPTGCVAQAFESRSQHENRASALARLRVQLALTQRRSVDIEGFAPSPELLRILPGKAQRVRGKNPAFWPGARDLLDLLAAHRWALAPTAESLGLSSGALSRLIVSEPELLRAVNAQRASAGLHPLR